MIIKSKIISFILVKSKSISLHSNQDKVSHTGFLKIPDIYHLTRYHIWANVITATNGNMFVYFSFDDLDMIP
jgi:hypothetical protein